MYGFMHMCTSIHPPMYAHMQQFLVRASYLEIYNEEIRDLLAKVPICACSCARACMRVYLR